MKKDFSVECWIFNHPIKARIVINDLQIYREFHPLIDPGTSPVDIKKYYFIEGYDGALELNQAPENELTAILLKELADAIELRLNTIKQQNAKFSQSYTPRLSGGSPSAAA